MRDDQVIFVFGKRPATEALTSCWPVLSLTVRDEGDGSVQSIVALAKSRGVPVTCPGRSAFDRKFPRTSQGVALLVKPPGFLDVEEALEAVPEGTNPLFLALDGIEDPHNLGAITRTALAIGAHGVVVPRRRTAGLGEGAAKSSAGAVFKQTLCQVPNIDYFTQWAKRNGLWVYGLDGDGEKTVWDVDFKCGVGLIVGSEGRGLSRLVRKRCDLLIKIPMTGPIDSLNASVACGMALYEAARQRAR